jgi:hypothetical protein
MDRIASTLAGALPGHANGAARHQRAASAGRTELGELLAAKDLRKLADRDPELNAAVTQAGEASAAAEKTAAAWHKALAEATRKWQASLTELSQLHPS